MFCILKFTFFFFCCFSFGFILLNQILKIRSLLILIPLSVSLGIATYVFLCHSLSFLIGPQLASLSVLCILPVISLLILIIKYKRLTQIENEINNFQLLILGLIALIVCTCTYLAVSKYGTFDRESHMPIALTMFHNNVYPPRDCFRPDYVLLYHYGGDLLAGIVYYITKFDISTSYELISTILSGTTFLSFFALAWILTKEFKLSLIAGFCTYFAGGLLWLDAILRYFTKNLPEGASNWTFFQTYLNLGIHGGINNAPSVLTFISTFDLGNPLLVFSLILFWKMTEEKKLKSSVLYIIFLAIALFTLFLTADWLFITFWVTIFPFLFILWIDKKKRFIISTLILLVISAGLNKSIGNALFLQDQIQALGRTNIFDVGIKENLFSVVSWGRLSSYVMNYQIISCFSWDFICELGLSIFLFPIALIYLIKTKNRFAYLLFFSVITTMPVPTIIDFKLNPVELVRLFAFGNAILILLITCGVAFLYKSFFQKKSLTIIYITVFCLSPVSQLISGAVFSPHVFSNKFLTESISQDFKKLKSINDFASYYKAYGQMITSSKNKIFDAYKNEIEFLKSHGKQKDVALSSIFQIPAYAGIYSLISPGKLIYWDQLYSSYNQLSETLFRTLDPYLLKELNITWLVIDNDFKTRLSKDIQDILKNQGLFKLVYTSPDKTKQWFEIYHIENAASDHNTRKTAWILINKYGNPINSSGNKLFLFSTSYNALLHLKHLQENNPALKKELITAQPIVIQNLEKQIATSNLNITLEKMF